MALGFQQVYLESLLLESGESYALHFAENCYIVYHLRLEQVFSNGIPDAPDSLWGEQGISKVD